jgi:hypothetical protein
MKFKAQIFWFLLLFGCLTVGARADDRALVVGIENYLNTPKCDGTFRNPGCVSPTYGGQADAEEMAKFIQKRFGFPAKNIKILTENAATAQNIRQSFRDWIIAKTNPGDRVFFFYSGHGFRLPDNDDDETVDHQDEALAPFDVQTAPVLDNYIRDDEINEWIGAIPDRQVVFLFDSCHSGTISRTVGSKATKFSKYLVTEPNSRNIGDVFSPIPKTRDLGIVKDSYLRTVSNTVVVISAAGAYQEAVWLDAANNANCNSPAAQPKWRGALSYLFENIYDKPNYNPTVFELNNKLKSEMAALKNRNMICPGSNGSVQEPEIDFAQNSPVKDAPLWGAAFNPNSNTGSTLTEATLSFLQNPLSTIKSVKLVVNEPTGAYKLGKIINYSVTVSEPAYIYVVVFSENSVATCIYPKTGFAPKSNYLTRIDETGIAQEPIGKDIWVAIASRKELRLGQQEELSWNEAFSQIALDSLRQSIQNIAKNRGRGVGSGTKIEAADWQSSILVMTTLP